MSGGGAPPPAFDINEDMKALAAEFSSATNIKNYYSTPADQRTDARNRFIAGRLVQIDLNYIQYIRSLTADKQLLDTGTELANLSLSLAGTLVGSARAKTNLAAAATGLVGAKTTIDKEYFYQKSMDALVGTMNAKRKEVLAEILTGLHTRTVNEYPFEQALTQLNEYYLAGTINGALRFINTQAAMQEKASDDKIKNIPTITKTTQEQVDATGRLTDSINLKLNPGLTADGARTALVILGDDIATLPTALPQLQLLLSKKIKSIPPIESEKKTAEIQRITDAFQKAGILISK